jgi:spore coat protein U-like protein
MTRLARRAAPLALLLGLCNPAKAFVNCGVTATALNFGTYVPTATTETDSTASVVVNCTITVGLSVSWTVALATGNSGTYSSRSMANGSVILPYQIYIDSAHTMVWGDGSAGTSVNTGGFTAIVIGTGGATYTAYGKIPPLQSTATPGTYTDTILVTLTY